MKALASAPLFCLLALGCRAEAPGPPPARLPPVRDALAERVETLGRSLAAGGFTPLWELGGVAAPGETLSFGASFDTARRALAFAVGDDPLAALDLEVLDPEGGLVAGDTTADRRAVVTWIAAAGTRAELALTSAPGTRFRIAAFTAPPEATPPSLVGFFDSDPIDAPTFAEIERDTRARGFAPIAAPTEDLMARGERVSSEVRLAAGRCYAFAAAASAGIDAVTLRLLAGPRTVDVDSAGRRGARVVHCAEADGEARLVVAVPSGSGTVTSGGFSALRRDVAKDVGPPLRAALPELSIDDAFAARARDLAERGFGPVEVLLDKTTGTGDRLRAKLCLAPAECASVFGVADPSLGDLDLEIRSPDGQTLGSDDNPDAAPSVGLCADGAADVSVEAVAVSGAGRVRVAIARLPAATLPPLPAAQLTFLAREAVARFAAAGLHPARAAIALKRQAHGPVRAVRVEVPGDACFGFSVVSDAVVRELVVRGPGSAPRDVRRGADRRADIARCSRAPGTADLEVALDPADPEAAAFLLVFTSAEPPGVPEEGYP